ncbi:MAG: hypothetical protein QOG39_1935 [Acidimicrobiaceae bacterium]
MIGGYEPDGSLPLDEATAGRTRRPLSDRATVAAVVLALLLVAAVVGLIVANRSDSGTARTSGATSSAPPATTQDGRNLSQVSNAEMEAVIAANPDVVPMRLALVDRYLQAADSEPTVDAARAQLQSARFHAGEAAARATTTTDHAHALRDLGWSTARLDDPSAGAKLLEQSLAEEPDNPDGVWFLANVRFSGLHDPAGAAPLLAKLLTGSLVDSQRQAITQLQAKVEASLGGTSTTVPS